MHTLAKTTLLCLVLLAGPALADVTPTLPSSRDGQHDFDFNVGTWHTHIRYLQHPLSDHESWTTFDGTVVGRKLWDGQANFEEIEADGPTGHFEGLTLSLYDKQAQQWSQYFANSNGGQLDAPTLGAFKDGHGEFYGQDTVDGKTVLVRMIWKDFTPTRHRVEQSFSADGGKTWEVNFVGDLTATTEQPKVPTAFVDPAQHDFDWQLGSWDIHMKRMLHPLSATETWTTYDGTVEVSKVWGGRANLAVIDTKGPTGHLQFLSLRLYEPKSHQWTLNFAHAGSDLVGSPMHGRFHDGKGEFYNQSTLDGKGILERFVFEVLKPGSRTRDEQSFSADGGKTWETNWINTQETSLDDEGLNVN
ncbi:MAG TPA: hypothetical protein VLV87_01465 [Gammaproteobacteria bacterium]|nr:hypothetical protein [Gammaproteobacteria bacterium]